MLAFPLISSSFLMPLRFPLLFPCHCGCETRHRHRHALVLSLLNPPLCIPKTPSLGFTSIPLPTHTWRDQIAPCLAVLQYQTQTPRGQPFDLVGSSSSERALFSLLLPFTLVSAPLPLIFSHQTLWPDPIPLSPAASTPRPLGVD